MSNHFKNKNPGRSRRFSLAAGLVLLALGLVLPAAAQAVTVDVVAMDQVLVYNRMGAINPAGMIYALARDIETIDPGAGFVAEDGEFINPLTPCATGDSLPDGQECQASDIGNVALRADKRPRPLTLRVNEGDQLVIHFTNLLSPSPITDAMNEAPGIGVPDPIQSEQPVTRYASIHVHGLKPATIASDGSNVGNATSPGSLVPPGGTATYTFTALKEGAYSITSGPNLGGEGGSGAIANGLFGIVNVEPAGSKWYRSQLTRQEMDWARNTGVDLGETECGTGNDPGPGFTCLGQPIINYEADYPPEAGTALAGKPILRIVTNGAEAGGTIFHNELNAIIVGPLAGGSFPSPAVDNHIYPNRTEPFREFTIAFHDEIKVVQAFPEWYAGTAVAGLDFTLKSVKDGFAVNYGTGGIGSEIIGNRLGVGPMKNCTECKYEEFFLTSWVVGDPAMIVDVPATISDPATGDVATKAFYPDDPSNTFHGYLNDRTKIRNIHVGTEHHVFHLHTHQWHFAPDDPGSNYLDAQALGPGSSFTYEIAYGGGGNRNKTAGDMIFHCHFYPHFAQGMWGLWRVHDVFEMGTILDLNGRPASGPGNRALPDGEIAAGTPIPGVVPLPGKAMAPMPGAEVTIVAENPGTAAVASQVQVSPLPGETVLGNPGYPFFIPGITGHRPPTPPIDLADDGGLPRHVITGGTADPTQTPTNFDKVLLTATGFELPEGGTAAELAAMAFHGPQTGPTTYTHDSYMPDGSSATGTNGFEVNGLPPVAGAPYAEPCRDDDGTYADSVDFATKSGNRLYEASVIELEVELNKVGWHFSQQRIIALNSDLAEGVLQKAPEPFVMRANSYDCVDFKHTNLVPNVYEADDFQVRTPTDVIGQHIHLVKFDVTSADGAANGWNYEDGTMSPDEVHERLVALTDTSGSWEGLSGSPALNPNCGTDNLDCARTTIQRWYIDPGWTGNVFSHDHYGPSTHQQAGLYATLLIEPQGSTWHDSESGEQFGGGEMASMTQATWRADIHTLNSADSYREFYLEFADFQIAYDNGRPVNPSDRIEVTDPWNLEGALVPRPEAISAADPGTFVVNYRHEPLALRVSDGETNPGQAPGLAGDLSYAFQSRTDRAIAELNDLPALWPYPDATATTGALAGDPFTPLLRVYQGDKVRLRVQVGAHEEGHNFSINGIKWLQQWASPYSGFRSSQMAGISEQFIFEVPKWAPAQGNPEVAAFDDYLYKAGSSVDAIWNGSWGFMRAFDDVIDDLQPLPSNPTPGGQNQGKGKKNNAILVCPENADIQKYSVVAVAGEDVLPDLQGDLPGDVGFDGGTLVYNSRPDNGGPLHDPTALLYVLEDDLEPIDPADERCLRQVGNNPRNPKFVVDVTQPGCPVRLRQDAPDEPLILRAAAGECIEVDLHNKLLEQAVDENSTPVFLEDGTPVFEDPGAGVDLFVLDVNGDPTVLATGPVTFDAIPDLDGSNTMPIIVEKFNANQVKPSAHVGLHAQLVGYDVQEGDGNNVGFNKVQTAAPGGKVFYKWYAGHINPDGTHTPVEFGGVNLMASDPIKGSNKGLIGGLVIEPQNSSWRCDDDAGPGTTDCYDSSDPNYPPATRAAATVTNGGASFRDFVAIFQDDVNMRFGSNATFPAINGIPVPAAVAGGAVPTVSAEEEPEDSGQKGLNFRTEPSWFRLGYGPTAVPTATRTVDYTDVWSNSAVGGDPQTPIFTAAAGDSFRFRVLKPGGHNRNNVFTLHGYLWARHPFNDGSTEIDPLNSRTFWHGEQMGHGPTNHANVVPLSSAAAGDWLYRDMVPVHVDNGEWGIFRVTAP
jgi:hypothetical protein